jgi:hypothetical protein
VTGEIDIDHVHYMQRSEEVAIGPSRAEDRATIVQDHEIAHPP